MFEGISREYNQKNADQYNERLILESVVEDDEIDLLDTISADDEVDTDSVPSDAYKRLDKVLDSIVSSEKYDDTEIEELIDDDDDLDEAVNAAIDY